MPAPASDYPASYYMILASLPHMPRTFEVEHVPISRLRLDQRLSLLSARDAEIVDQVQRFWLWDRQPAERTDQEVHAEYHRLMQVIRNPLLRSLIAFRMDVRTITCALRRRRLGMAPPEGVGRWVEQIRRQWDHPDFRLLREHPWIPAVREDLERNAPLQVERRLLQVIWNRWTRLADDYHFSFESLLLYLARWEIVDRWTRRNEPLGCRRLETLLAEVPGDHAPFPL